MKRIKRTGTLLTSDKPVEFSSGVLTKVGTGEVGFHPFFKTEAEYKYFQSGQKDPIKITEIVKEAEEFRTQLNMGQKNKYSYSREFSPGSGRALGLEESEMEAIDELSGSSSPMFERKLSKYSGRFSPGGFNYEDLTEKQARKELDRILGGIRERAKGVKPWVEMMKGFFNKHEEYWN